MIIDRSHRVWFIGSLLALALAGLLYVPYALTTVTGTSGGSAVGLIYGSIGSAMMLFAGLLGARKKFPTWRVGRGTFWMRGHLWIGFLSFPFILSARGLSDGWRPAYPDPDGTIRGGLSERHFWRDFAEFHTASHDPTRTHGDHLRADRPGP